MQPSLCKKHFRDVANYFDKQTAFAYGLDDSHCVICDKVIFIEGARRFANGEVVQTANDEALPSPNAFAHLGA